MINLSSTDEEQAAKAIRSLAEALQTLLYYREGESLSKRSITILTRCYRELKPAADWYFQEHDSPLVWDGGAPGTPYSKRRK